MVLQTFPSAGGTASADGVFIPVTNLVNGGLQTSADLADAVAANLKRDRAIWSIVHITTSYISGLAAGLALGVSVQNPTLNSLSLTYGLTLQTYELRNGASPLAVLPVPLSGTNSGVGDFAITDIFAGATKVSSGATISESGVLIASADLARYGAPVHASLSVSGDNRSWFGALFRYLANDTTNIPSRSATAASAITGRSVATPSVFSLPTAATAATNPTTAISSSDLDIVVPVQFTASITIALALSDPSAQTYDVDSRIS